MNKKRSSLLFLFALLFLIFIPATAQPIAEQVGKSKAILSAHHALNIVHQQATPRKVITVAVVDDGFRLTHKALNKYIFTNEQEIPNNFQDDDRNGYVDDVQGWDVSNNDNDVSVRHGNEEIFYHGTYIASLIASIFEGFYGDEAANYLRIIPIKAVSDNAKNTYISDGYKGIRYAISLKPDVICCAWSGGNISEDEKALIYQASQEGIMIVASAGNFASEKVEIPASLPGVIAVAALDSTNLKNAKSNFGMRIDIAAPGTQIYGAHPKADNAYVYIDGTSPATALVAGCLAALKAAFPSSSSTDLVDAIKFTSTAIDESNLTYAGKLGAGVPNMQAAIHFLQNPDYKYVNFNPKLPKGKLFISQKKKIKHWDIQPVGAFKGMHLYADIPVTKGDVQVYAEDSLHYSGSINQLRMGIYLSGNHFRIEKPTKTKVPKNFSFSYQMETVDSTTLYCKDTQFIYAEYGTISDNSGAENYANNSACKWQIVVPQGKRVLIEFTHLDTQPNVDNVMIFDGTMTHPDNLLAQFSGSTPPPIIQSHTHEVLIWFVTDSHTTASGWQLNFTALE